MKDERDRHTIDGIPKKRGRPVVDPEQGPMTGAQRVAAYRARKRKQGDIREVPIPVKTWARLQEIATRRGVTVTDVIVDAVAALPMPRRRK